MVAVQASSSGTKPMPVGQSQVRRAISPSGIEPSVRWPSQSAGWQRWGPCVHAHAADGSRSAGERMRYATLRQAATRLLEHEAGGGHATAEDLAAAAGRLLDRLSQRLAQVIGQAGVEAILRRAVKMRKAELPFLDERVAAPRNRETSGEALRACLQDLEPDVVRNATVMLVATFAGLLATVIGHPLAWRLLRDVWSDALLPEIEPQEAQE